MGYPHLAFSERALKPRRPQHTKQQQQRITGPVRIRAEFSQTRFGVPSCIGWAGCGFQNSVPLAGNDSRTTSTCLSDKEAAKSYTLFSGSGRDLRRSFGGGGSCAGTAADGKKFAFLLTSLYQLSL